MTQHGKSTRTRTSTKRSIRRVGVCDRARATMGSSWFWMHGRAAWGAQPCTPFAPELFRFPSCPFVFPRDFSVLPTILPLR